jgi:hypothetical protein
MSTLTVKELAAPTGYDLKIASGETLDLKSQGTVTMPAGAILQVVQGTSTTELDTNSSSFVDSGLEATITPSSTSSKILASVHAPGCGCPDSSNAGSFGVYVLASYIGGSETRHIWLASQAGYTASTSADFITVVGNHLYSPNTTNAVTYKLILKSDGSGTQRFLADDQAGADPTGVIILQEVAG